MSDILYWLGLIVPAIGYPAAVAWAVHRTGRRHLWLITIVAVVVLLIVGVFDWRSQRHQDTGLETYVLLASVPPVSTSVLITQLADRQIKPFAQAVSGGVFWILVSLGILIVSYFYL